MEDVRQAWWCKPVILVTWEAKITVQDSFLINGWTRWYVPAIPATLRNTNRRIEVQA
jgi:hypothetical protein